MPEPMRVHQFDVILLDEYKAGVSEELHKTGVTQIEFIGDDDIDAHGIKRDRPLKRATDISKNLVRINRIIGALKQFDIEKPTFLEEMLGVGHIKPEKVSEKNCRQLLNDSEKLLEEIESKVLGAESELDELKTKQAGIEEIIENCGLCPEKLKAEYLGDGSYIYITTGVFSDTIDGEKINGIRDGLSKAFGKNHFIIETVIEQKKNEGRKNIVVGVLREGKAELNEILNKFSVRVLMIEGEGKVSDIYKNSNKKLEEIRVKMEELVKKLEETYKKHYKGLLIAKELLEIEKERAEVFVSAGRTSRTSMLRFWVPENESLRIRELIKERSENHCEITQRVVDPENAPVILKNPDAFKPFEFLISMYGLPKYGHLDPTIFVIPVLIFFIGMMVADAVTGVLLVGLGFFLRNKYGRYSDGIKNLFTFVILCGAMTICVGVVTGDYFGNFLHHYVFHLEEGQALPGQFMFPENAHHPFGVYFFLQFTIILGLCHLILGTLLGGYNELRHKKTKDAVTHYFSWSLFGVGLGALFFSDFEAFPIGGAFHFPPILGETGVYVAAALVILGLILAFLKTKFMIAIEMLDFFAFTLSYARIMALLVAAGAVATAFNKLAAMSWGGIMSIFAILIFIVTQAIGMILAILDGFVQSLRLVYVEHFSRYYEGGGKEFKPFKAKRKYTQV